MSCIARYFVDSGGAEARVVSRVHSMCAREERPRSPRTRSPCNGFTTLLLIALVPTPPSCDARSPDVSDSTWCQAVPAEAKVCRAPGRRDMRFPNLLAERRESHVSARALRWAPLLSSSCHPDVRLFLCAVLAPQCLDRFVQPCRSLCEVVRDACTISSSCSAVPEFGVWPSEIKCEAFPPGPEGCISETVNSISRRKDVVMHNCHYCRARQASSIGALMQTFCGHDIVLPVRLIRLTPAVPRVIIAETHHTSMRPAISAWVRQHAPCAARLARPYPGSQFVILGRLTKEGHLDVQSVYAWEAEDKVVALGLALWPWHKRSC